MSAVQQMSTQFLTTLSVITAYISWKLSPWNFPFSTNSHNSPVRSLSIIKMTRVANPLSEHGHFLLHPSFLTLHSQNTHFLQFRSYFNKQYSVKCPSVSHINTRIKASKEFAPISDKDTQCYLFSKSLFNCFSSWKFIFTKVSEELNFYTSGRPHYGFRCHARF